MPRSTPILNQFTSGELSPRLEGRVDLARYYSGAKELTNMLVHPHGGASSRFGTCFVAEVKDSTKPVRLIPFEFSTEQAYLLELGHEYIRFYKDCGQILDGGGSTPYEIASPWSSEDIFELKFAQTADIMYLVHKDYSPRVLSRTGHAAWSLDEIEFIDGPYLAEATDAGITPSATSGTITLTASTSIFNEDHVGSLFRWKANNSSWYWFKITSYSSGTSVQAEVKGDNLPNTTQTSSYKFGAWSVDQGFPSVTAFYEQRAIFGATVQKPQTLWGSKTGDYEDFTPGTSDDDPWTYTFAAQLVNVLRWLAPARYLVAGTVGGEWIVSSGVQDEAITPTRIKIRQETTYGSTETSSLHVGHSILFIQRAGRKVRDMAYRFEEDNYDAPDLTILSEHITQTGIKEWAVQPQPDSIIWAIRNDGKLLSFTYDKIQDVAAWTRHETEGEFESIAVVPETDHDQVWFIVNRIVDGSEKRYVEYFKHQDMHTSEQEDLFYIDSGLTFHNSADITGVTLADPIEIECDHSLSDGDTVYISGIGETGTIELNDTAYTVESSTTGVSIALEGIDGTSGYSAYTAGADGTVEETVDTVTGLDHLEGEAVSILGDGAVLVSKTVTSGGIALSRSCRKAHVGLPFTCVLEPMNIEAGASDGTAQGKIQRINKLVVRFFKTLGAKIGSSADDLEAVPFREPVDKMGTPPSIFTGDKVVLFPGGYSRAGNVRIVQDQPLPMTVLAIIPQVTANDI